MPMASASNELRAKMFDYFGDRIDCAGPLQFLMEAGYREEKNGFIIPPVPFRDATEKENDCIDFLCEEWDFVFDACGA